MRGSIVSGAMPAKKIRLYNQALSAGVSGDPVLGRGRGKGWFLWHALTVLNVVGKLANNDDAWHDSSSD